MPAEQGFAANARERLPMPDAGAMNDAQRAPPEPSLPARADAMSAQRAGAPLPAFLRPGRRPPGGYATICRSERPRRRRRELVQSSRP